MKQRKAGNGSGATEQDQPVAVSPGKRSPVQRRYAGQPAPESRDDGEPLTGGDELLEGGSARVEGGTIFSGPDEAISTTVPPAATPDKTDAEYETTMGIDTAIAAKRMVPVAGVHGKSFTAVGCAGKPNGKVTFTFDRAFVGDYDYAAAGKAVRGAHVCISAALSGCGVHTDVKLLQVLRNFKKTDGKVETVQPSATMRKKRSGTDDPTAASRGWRVDETESGRSPFYVTSDLYGAHGSSTKAAKLRDSPGDWLTDRNVGKEFRTCAVSYAEGKGTVLACVDWGYYIDGSGSASFYPAAPKAHVGATKEVTDAIARWDTLPGHTKVNLK